MEHKYPLIKLKGKDYLEVKWRIVWFREDHPDWTIETEIASINFVDCYCLSKAIIKNEQGKIMATAHKFETLKGFHDFIEKSETGSVGRALALLGYGTANAIEIEEGERIVDAPVESKTLMDLPKIHKEIVHGAGEFEVPYGREKGTKIKNMSRKAIEENLLYWQTYLSSKGEKPQAKLQQYLIALQTYLSEIGDKKSPIDNLSIEEDIPF